MRHRISAILLTGILTIIMGSLSPAAAQTARVKPYKVSPSLAEVANLRTFNKKIPLSAAQKKMLAQNLFAVSPGKSKQLFHIYEDNDYKDLPTFVTTDSVLHLYHIFFDFTLRTVEEQTLTPVLENLTRGLLDDSIRTWNEMQDSRLKQAALKNIAYFAVPARLLGLEVQVPAQAENLISLELDLIDRHEGFAEGAIFPYRLDYSQFAPRGHYTRSETLQKFFRVMMWYGLAPFALETNEGRADETIRQSLLLTRSLYRANLQEDWETIYEPTAFYVGAADDITPAEWKTAAESVFGANFSPAALIDAGKFDAFVEAAKKLRPAQIQFKNLNRPNQPESADTSVQFRFMGQRYIPDSEILQRLSEPVKRVFPTGLDVMAVLGSKRAESILDGNPQLYNPENWAQYAPERAKLFDQFSKTREEKWRSNLYWSWLYALQSLLGPAPAGYPSFMQSAAWQDKSLNSALGSWAQLRHDTILYGKQSGAEMGDGGDEPPPYKGYVEPNVVFWDRMLDLLVQSREGLSARNLLPEELGYQFESFEDTLKNLKQISEKELRNEKLTFDEYQSIRQIGGTLEYLTLSVMNGQPDTWELVNEADKDMAVIADVHTGGNKVLEEAVGRANEIFVIVPIEGKLVLTRGAIFSYYEFIHPASDRLTDEKWQKMLDSGRAPAPPAWTKSFLLPRVKGSAR